MHELAIDRRAFCGTSGAMLAGASLTGALSEAAPPDAASSRVFRLWAMGDSHVGTDLKRGRESLADAIRQSEQGGKEGGPAFEWDIAVHVGDLSGGQESPTDD